VEEVFHPSVAGVEVFHPSVVVKSFLAVAMAAQQPLEELGGLRIRAEKVWPRVVRLFR
jgi:hypothetical protein